MNTSGTNSGHGSITIIQASCVSASRTAVSVSVNPSPSISVTSGTICNGNAFTMVPSGASTYTFQGGNAVVSPTTNTTYTVTGTNANGCVASAFATCSVVVNASPLPTISVNNGTICAGASFTMVPSGASTYTFQGGNAVVSPTANATYTVVGTNTAGCVSQTFATSNVSVTAAPAVGASTSATLICAGQTASITASGASTYTWNTAATTTVIAVSPTVTTSYTVTGTNAAGCANSFVISQAVSACTGLGELNASESNLINVYPNPNIGEFIVELNSNAQLIIVNLLGQEIYNEKMSAGKQKINIQNQAKGTYFVKVIQDGKQHIVKITKD